VGDCVEGYPQRPDESGEAGGHKRYHLDISGWESYPYYILNTQLTQTIWGHIWALNPTLKARDRREECKKDTTRWVEEGIKNPIFLV
jgi:hypothetical protein